ncbi:MAG: hypothetical protein WCN88_03915 [Candidatus Falkowbacteria bacterium]
MKKLFLIIVAAILVPTLTFAQAKATNTTSKSITIKPADKSSELVIAPHKKAVVSFAPASGTFKFYLFYYEGMNEKSAGLIEKNITKGEFDITSGDLSGQKQTVAKTTENDITSKAKSYVGSSSNPTTTLVLVDSSDYKVVALDGPFVGTALAPNQTSQRQFIVETGQLEVTFKHDVIKESEDMAKGRKYRQSVYSGIIVEGQTMLVLKNENLMELKGEPLETLAKSLIPYKISFTAGPWKGQALRCGDYTKKAQLSEGFNSLAIQFVGSDGLKYQADIEVIVTKHDKPLFFRETDIVNKKVIKQ